jgi:transcriptional regulator GlxA family with amidase domain
MVSSVRENHGDLTMGILIFEQVEILDVAGPFEVFSVTRLNEEHRWKDSSPFKVLLVSETMDQVLAIGGLRLTPDVTIDNCPELDLLIVPGDWGTRREVRNNNNNNLKWIAARAAKTRLTASVCTGSSLLGKAGLLDGLEATTPSRAFDFLRESAPGAQIREDVRFTLVEPIFTSAGVSAGIDLALRIVNHFFGIEIAQGTARHMEYPYPEGDLRMKDS